MTDFFNKETKINTNSSLVIINNGSQKKAIWLKKTLKNLISIKTKAKMKTKYSD